MRPGKCEKNLLYQGFQKSGDNSLQCSFIFYVPLKVISAHNETSQSVGGAKTGEPRDNPPGTPTNRTWLVSHVPSAGLEPTPDTAVR